MERKKLERWCTFVRAPAQNMLTSSLNTPAGAALLSSEALNVLTLSAHSAVMTECVSDNDSECDGEDDQQRDGEDDHEQLSLEWELGSGEDGYLAGQVTYTVPEVSDLSNSSPMGKFLSYTQYAFTFLEPYANGTPTPSVVTKEVDMNVTAPFLLAKPDFSKTEVVKAYVHTIVAPTMDYWKETIEVKKGAQLGRMKAVRIFNPLHILGNKISVSDIDGLKIFKLHEHPEILYRFVLRLR
jgi:hypothetical protein